MGMCYLLLSLSTVLVMYDFEDCINRIVNSLETVTKSVDAKFKRFSDFAVTVATPTTIVSEAIRNADFYDRCNIIDCELASLCF